MNGSYGISAAWKYVTFFYFSQGSLHLYNFWRFGFQFSVENIPQTPCRNFSELFLGTFEKVPHFAEK